MTERNRPRQVTLAAWVIVFGSLATLVTTYDQLARLHSLDMRESVRRALADPPFDGLGVGVHTVLDVMHALALVTGACATAAVVLGWHVLRRHRPSRIALTVVAVPLLLAGIGSGGFFSTLVAVAVLLLWLPPGGQWFQDAPSSLESSSTQGFRDAPSSHDIPAATEQHQPEQRPVVAARPASAPGQRPAVVTCAAVLTWMFSAVASVTIVIGAALVTADPGPILRQALEQNPSLADQGMTEGLLVASSWFLAALVVGYSIATSVVAAVAWRRTPWARTTLVVLLAVAAGFLLIGTLLAPVLVVGLTGALVTLVLLLRGDARAWFEGRDR